MYIHKNVFMFLFFYVYTQCFDSLLSKKGYFLTQKRLFLPQKSPILKSFLVAPPNK